MVQSPNIIARQKLIIRYVRSRNFSSDFFSVQKFAPKFEFGRVLLINSKILKRNYKNEWRPAPVDPLERAAYY